MTENKSVIFIWESEEGETFQEFWSIGDLKDEFGDTLKDIVCERCKKLKSLIPLYYTHSYHRPRCSDFRKLTEEAKERFKELMRKKLCQKLNQLPSSG